MGQAKRRGTYEQRKAEAENRDEEKYLLYKQERNETSRQYTNARLKLLPFLTLAEMTKTKGLFKYKI